jgi:two-component system chemotaxis response regulator CheB
MPIVIAAQGTKLEPGHCYIGEPAAHLVLMADNFGDIEADPNRLHGNRTVDVLFKSIAKHAGKKGIGVVLSGSLDDGSRGIEAIHEVGGKTMVILRGRLEKGMPENAIKYDGPISCIGSTDEIAEAIYRAVAAELPLTSELE